MGAASGTEEESRIDERALVAELCAGHESAFDTLVRSYGPRMLAVARRFFRNEQDALDALQDAFLQAFRAIGTFQGGSRLGSWLHRIVVNAALMRRRSRQHTHEAGSDQIEALLPTYYPDGHRINPRAAWQENTEELVQRDETRRIVRECIGRLPEDYRLVLLLRDIEQFDTEQTAAQLGVSEGVVKTRLHRARQALRTLLERHFVKEA